MKNIQLTSREEDLEIFAVVGVVLFLGVVGLVGFNLPEPFTPLGGAILSISLMVLVWAIFHLAMPVRHSQKWTIFGRIIVPVVWLLLVIWITSWFHAKYGEHEEQDILMVLKPLILMIVT